MELLDPQLSGLVLRWVGKCAVPSYAGVTSTLTPRLHHPLLPWT